MKPTRANLKSRARRHRLLTSLVAAGALSQLSSCFLFNEFKTDGWAVEDECFRLLTASLCIDFDTGQLEATGLQAQVADSAHCKSIKKISITGWVDKNDNDTEDEGEAIESTEHEVAEEEGSNSVVMGDVSLSLNASPAEASDVHVRIEVERVGAENDQVYNQVIEKC